MTTPTVLGDGTTGVPVKRRVGAGRGYTSGVPKRDPHEVLGVARGAEPGRIKAAWRRLARAHHPDLTGDDPAASRVATRRMAEINDAYAALMREASQDRAAAARPTWVPTARPAGAARHHPAPRDRSPVASTRPRPIDPETRPHRANRAANTRTVMVYGCVASRRSVASGCARRPRVRPPRRGRPNGAESGTSAGRGRPGSIGRATT